MRLRVPKLPAKGLTHGHPYKLHKQRSSCTAQSSFFTKRVVNIWNSLPADRDFITFRFY